VGMYKSPGNPEGRGLDAPLANRYLQRRRRV
jgi:hypothetical protein